MAPSTRRSTTNPPRRKSSQAHAHQRGDSWELLQSARQRDAEQMNGHNDVTNAEEHSGRQLNGADQMIHPLRDLAERIGREVELFAEKLDSWKPKEHDEIDMKRKAARGLVESYRAIAQDTVSRLQKQHGAERARALREEWRRFSKPSNADTATDADTGEECDVRAKTTIKDLEQWQAELHTWQLVSNLLECRHSDQDPLEQARKLAFSNDNDRFMADGKPWIDFLAVSDSAREKLVILRWLEGTAEQTGNDLEIIEEELEVASGKGKSLFGHGWMDTREKLKGEKRLRLWDTTIDSGIPDIKSAEGTDLLVTQLDLDAWSRQTRTIESPDGKFEASFWAMCWEMLKRGKSMDEIHEWCAERNEFARAVSLSALPLEDLSQQTAWSITSRFCWRQACAALSQEAGLSSHERAVYGLLSGEYKNSERGCRGWNDNLWAGYSSHLLNDYTTFLAKHHMEQIPQNFRPVLEASDIANYDDMVMSARATMDSLQLKKDSHLDATQPLKLIQANILSHRLPEFAMHQGVALSRQTRRHEVSHFTDLIALEAGGFISRDKDIIGVTDNPNALRVLVHLILIFEDLGVDFGSGEQLLAVENVICEYIDFIRLAGKFNLIPVYASMLSPERGTMVMARALTDIINPDERIDAVELMVSSGLDVVSILRTQYEFAVDFSLQVTQEEADFSGVRITQPVKDDMWPGQRIATYNARAMHEDDEILIQSLEWFLLVEGHWAMSFAAMTDVAKRFLGTGRIDAAFELFHRVPFIEVSMILTTGQIGKKVDIMDDHEGSDEESTPVLRRSARRRPMFKAQRGPRSATPQKNKVLRDLLKYHARTYYELNQLVTALEALWNWRAAEDQHLEHVDNISESDIRQRSRICMDDLISAMEPLMHEFLQHPGPSDTAEQLKEIRCKYLPEMVMGYISALHSGGHLLTREHLLQIMTVATEMAENEDLIGCFTATGRMTELVDAFAMSSKTMLRLNEEATNKNGKRKKSRTGKNLGMWEISA